MEKFLSEIKSFLDEIIINEEWYQNIKKDLKAIVLYGSAAKGINRHDSDIDLLFILPIEIEEKYTKGEYFYQYRGQEFNIVIRSIEKLREITSGKPDLFQAEIFRKNIIIWEKDSEVKNLINKIVSFCQIS